MKLIAKELSMAQIRALTLEQQDELARSFVKGKTKLEDLKGEQKEGAKVMGKLLCELEIRMEKGKKANAIAANKTLAEFFKDQYGEKVQTHPLSLKNAFGAYVVTGLISEMDYDVNSGNCLELAARILTAVNGDLTHEAIAKAAFQLKERSSAKPNEATNLREILASVKPAAKITAEEAIEMIDDLCADGHTPLVIAKLPDIILAMPAEMQRDNYLAFVATLEKFDKAIGDKIDQWMKAREAASAPPQLNPPPTTETPAPQLSVLTPPVDNSAEGEPGEDDGEAERLEQEQAEPLAA